MEDHNFLLSRFWDDWSGRGRYFWYYFIDQVLFRASNKGTTYVQARSMRGSPQEQRLYAWAT